MPSRAALELMVQLKGNAAKDMDDMAKKGGGLGRMFGGLISPLTLVTAGVGALGAGLVVAVKAAADEQVGIERLNVALKNSVPDWENQTAAVNASIKAAQKKAFSDDEARDSMALLVGVTKDVALANDAMTAAMDLARLKNISLETATGLLAGAFNGKTKALEKLGVELEKGASKTDILAATQKLAGGQAEAYANTTAGSMDRLKNAFDDALENVGSVILPKVTEALRGVADFVSSEEFQGALTGAVDLIGNGLSWAAKTVGPPLIEAAKNLGKFVGAVASGDTEKIKELFKDLPEPIRNVAGFLVDAAKGAADFVGKLAGGDMVAARELLKELPGPIGEIATGLFDAAKNATDFLGAQTPEGAQFWKDIAVDAENTGASLAKMHTDAETFLVQLKGINEAMRLQAEAEAKSGGLVRDWALTLQRGGDIIGGNIKQGMDELVVSLEKTHGGGEKLADILGTCSVKWDAGRADTAQAWWDSMYNLGLRTELTQEELAACSTALTMGLPEAQLAWTDCLTAVQLGLDACKTTGGEIAPALGAGVPAAQEAWAECNTTIKTGLDECKIKGETFWNYVLNPGVDGSEAESFWEGMLDRIRDAIAAAKRFWDEATKGAGGGGGGGGDNGRTYPDHGRAHGGPVTGGSTYMVGERGPELFTPRTSGHIIPNNAMGGNTIYLTVYAGIGADGRRIGQEALEVLSHQLGLQGRNVSHRGV